MRAGLTAVALLTAGLGACDGLRGGDGAPTATVEIAGRRFTMEIAADDASRIRGLQGRTSIPPDGGMLFVFPEPAVRSFWMAGCLTDIDVAFLDAQGRVTATHRMKAEPPRRPDETQAEYHARLELYSSVHPAQFALEFAAGTIDRLDVEVDDKVRLDLERLKSLARRGPP